MCWSRRGAVAGSSQLQMEAASAVAGEASHGDGRDGFFINARQRSWSLTSRKGSPHRPSSGVHALKQALPLPASLRANSLSRQTSASWRSVSSFSMRRSRMSVPKEVCRHILEMGRNTCKKSQSPAWHAPTFLHSRWVFIGRILNVFLNVGRGVDGLTEINFC